MNRFTLLSFASLAAAVSCADRFDKKPPDLAAGSGGMVPSTAGAGGGKGGTAPAAGTGGRSGSTGRAGDGAQPEAGAAGSQGAGTGGVSGGAGTGGNAGAGGSLESGGTSGSAAAGAQTLGSGGVADDGGAGAGGAPEPVPEGGAGGREDPPPMPVTVTVTDLEDTYVANDEPAVNFGSASELYIDAAPDVYRVFIQSPSLGGLPQGATVLSATLTLNCYDEGAEARITRALGPWSEDTLTWENAPAFATTFRSIAMVPKGPLAIDVTSFVQIWANGTPNYGFVLYTLATATFGGSDYCSTESVRTECTDINSRPSLTITWQ